MMNKINSVCVYCASSTKIDSVYFDAARELGTLLGQKHIRLINGAGNMGLMSAVSDAVLQAGGKVTGVIPRFMVEQGWHHTGLTRLVEVESMHERKKTMADLSDAVIALPGERQELFCPSARYASAGSGRKLHAYAARCYLACGTDTAGSCGADTYHSFVGRLYP